MITPTTTISRNRPPIHMDFEQLRAEGIRHLETLATHIWTDFNAHDPGITILEVLCYALTDLGYRIDLPLEDLLAAPADSKQKMFFSVDEALSNGPVTEIDFRKLIIDVPGVKNAWLEKKDGGYPLHYGATKEEGLCKYIPIVKGEQAGANLNLNGLYKVILELHDNSLESYDEGAKKIIAAVKYRLHANRNLCEDFVEINLITQEKIHLCIDLDIAPHADAVETMAKALFELQEFLMPTIKFHNLQQLLEKGSAGDEIYDGPVLQNGFIDDDELQKAQLPTLIQLSDLYGVLAHIPEILTVKEIKFLEGGKANENWCLPIGRGKKPIIDPCDSCLYVSQNGHQRKIKGSALEEFIAFNQLVNQDFAEGNISALDYPKGNYRRDLAEYTPIQYDFPRTYYVGDNELPDSAPTKHKAQSNQLKAFLLFFDRILANYLQKLGKVRDIFSLSQDINSSLVFFQTLEYVPGMKKLIFILTPEKAESLKSAIPIELFKKKKVLKIHTEIDDLVGTVLEDTGVLLTNWVKELKNDTDSETFIKKMENHLQKAVIGTKAYQNKLEKIALGEDSQAERKDEILNHLLARFGEQFTDYTLNLFETNELNQQKTFSHYLDDKTSYLGNLPLLSAARVKAYNYKLLNKEKFTSDTWNTENVSGLKKRVCAKMGIKANESTVFGEPVYRVNVKKDPARKRSCYYLEIVALSDEKKPNSETLKAEKTLLRSNKYFSKKTADKYEILLYEKLGTSDGFSDPTKIKDKEEGVISFSISLDGVEVLVMQSELMSKNAAIICLEEIKTIVGIKERGQANFHIVEHILLRPNDEKDVLLIPKITCNQKAGSPKIDPYSFWISVVLPAWLPGFEKEADQQQFKQLLLTETPAHIAVCFRWIKEKEQMKKFEYALKSWKDVKTKCTTDECKITKEGNELVNILNNIPCYHHCKEPNGNVSNCASPEAVAV